MAIFGHVGAGKSSICQRFVSGNFFEELDPFFGILSVIEQRVVISQPLRTEDYFRKQVCVDDEAAVIDLLYARGRGRLLCLTTVAQGPVLSGRV